ncbi:MAG TPA: TRAP transporter fused permease subunit [Thermodesulfobacteriota bacterium]|nr:TRAP transporter fused permease subunit [Thermodesulfobacteriota bacterium]
MSSNWINRYINVKNLIFFLSIVMFFWLCWYFYTGFGGPLELVAHLVPIALMLQVLHMHQNGYIYKRLSPTVNRILVVIYMGICVYAFYHFHVDYEQISIYRQGSYTKEDFIMGLLVFLLVMELSRITHSELFWVNVIMVFYTLWGYLSPIDFFWHPGTSFYRVITSSTVELSTGIYGQYAQIALTTIGAFLLLAAAARGFDAQGAMVSFMRRIAGKSRQTIPQTAVLASSAVGMISGSGAANATVVGAFTIPLMKRYGVPGEFAGAVETAASMGGLIMPPVMAVAGFIMAEYLDVPYWSVVLRGFALAFIYYSTLSLSIYLLSVSLMPSTPIEKTTMPIYTQLKTAIFFLGIIFLAVLMGGLNYGEQLSGLYTGAFMFSLLILLFLFFKYVKKDPAAKKDVLFANFRIMIETHAEMTSFLTLLLCTLGIMIGLFTVTGFINRMGGMLLRVGEFHIIALILMAYMFGWLVGAGLPPTATYIVLAVITVDPMRKLGIDPWVAHFFVFLLAVWGELSPPTSLSAAVSARIAEASFVRTMYQALKLCLPITLMTFAIFTRFNLVVNPGWLQIRDMLLVAVACWGITYAIFGKFSNNRASNVMMRAALTLVSFVVMFHPDTYVSIMAAVIVVPATFYGVIRHRRIAPPKDDLQPAQ